MVFTSLEVTTSCCLVSVQLAEKAELGVYTAALARAKTWKQSRCPWMDERIKKMWCVYVYVYVKNIHTV